MENRKTTTLSNSLLWFGASVSIAEIFTGTLIAPLGFRRGLLAIVIGHAVGCFLLYLAGLIGARSGKSAMETVGFSFGSRGRILFAGLNVLQLVGWTAVMIIGGARAMTIILGSALGFKGELLFCLVIGGLILLWVLMGITNLGKVNVFAVTGLLLLSVLLSFVVFNGGIPVFTGGTMSFGMALELSIAMPLSWLPLISDYTKDAKKPAQAAFASVLAYFAGSTFMYVIGLGAAIFTGESDIATIMFRAGLGLAGVLIILLSTVTTTYLDVYSAGLSMNAIHPKLSAKAMAVAATILGTGIAMSVPMERYESFLYLIGSVFAPMVTILITDYFILKKDWSENAVNPANLVLWAAGFLIYRFFMRIDTPIGSTLPVMAIVCFLCILTNGGLNYVYRNARES